MTERRYGCRADVADARDVRFRPGAMRLPAFPAAVDLRAHLPPPDALVQDPLSSCVAHGVSCALRSALIAAGKPDVALSRLQLYYDARDAEDSVLDDGGCEIRDAIKCAASIGVAREELWPYDPAKLSESPPPSVYSDAVRFEALCYERVAVNMIAVKTALASGVPVIVGISLYESFESDAVAANGVVPMPDLESEALAGGHCMLAWGYGQRRGYFSARNWWGSSWGDRGDCYVPEAMLGSPLYGSDYWLVRTAGAQGAGK